MLCGVILQASVGYATILMVYERIDAFCLVSISVTIIIIFIILGISVCGRAIIMGLTVLVTAHTQNKKQNPHSRCCGHLQSSLAILGAKSATLKTKCGRLV